RHAAAFAGERLWRPAEHTRVFQAQVCGSSPERQWRDWDWNWNFVGRDSNRGPAACEKEREVPRVFEESRGQHWRARDRR
ncbi:hypothetical protein KI387_013764, partial [Taxus chinensis]